MFHRVSTSLQTLRGVSISKYISCTASHISLCFPVKQVGSPEFWFHAIFNHAIIIAAVRYPAFPLPWMMDLRQRGSHTEIVLRMSFEFLLVYLKRMILKRVRG